MQNRQRETGAGIGSVLKRSRKVAVSELVEKPYASILCYPQPTEAELKRRLRQLSELGVKSLEFVGEKQVSGMSVLGKGCVGIVVNAHLDGVEAALKIRRIDADRHEMWNEARMLEAANSVMVGPKLLKVSGDFLLMQFINGMPLPRWFAQDRSKRRARSVLHDVLEQCYRLDVVGLDHGELSHAPKHIIVDKRGKAFIVDFETASLSRRVSNVTSACNYLFFGGLAERVREAVGKIDGKALIESLRRYKHRSDRRNFENVLMSCGL